MFCTNNCASKNNLINLIFLINSKGHGIVAATASIPSKYQTIVTDNSDKRGFGGQAKRFQSDYAMVS